MLIFPAIDMRNGNCVRLFRGDYDQETIYGDSPAAQAAVWEKEGAPLIHLVDLDGAKAGHPVNVEPIRRICETVSIPCELGGGIRTEKDAELIFSLGISRVILGTAACEDPELLRRFIRDDKAVFFIGLEVFVLLGSCYILSRGAAYPKFVHRFTPRRPLRRCLPILEFGA